MRKFKKYLFPGLLLLLLLVCILIYLLGPKRGETRILTEKQPKEGQSESSAAKDHSNHSLPEEPAEHLRLIRMEALYENSDH